MNMMELTSIQWILILALVVLVVGGIATAVYLRRRRTGRLRGQFGGAEYDRSLSERGGRRQAEAELDLRAVRVESFHVQPLSPADRTRFEESWRKLETRFVDSPAGAVAEADQLLGDVMSTRGYPVAEFDQRAADISVDHPVVLANYRAAHEIALRQMKGQASTEDLRQAMIHFRTLFEELVAEPKAA
jgi:hypothetical protein